MVFIIPAGLEASFITPFRAPAGFQRTLTPMRTLSHSPDDQAWQLLLVLVASNPEAPAAALVQKAYEVATEFEKFRQGRPTEPSHHAEPVSEQGG